MATADANNSYRRHGRLVESLPPLVRKQRRLAGQIAPLEQLVVEDKTVRAEIDALLLACGFKKGEGVTCSGYDVVHRERDGSTSYDIVELGRLVVEQLVALGMPREDIGTPANAETGAPASEDYRPGAVTFVMNVLAAVRSNGDPAKWAEVKPMKGAKVRAA
jgi:hypothetical protein